MERRRRSLSLSPDIQNDKKSEAERSSRSASGCFIRREFHTPARLLFTLIHVLDQALYVFRLMGYQFQLIDIAVGKDGCHREVLAT